MLFSGGKARGKTNIEYTNIIPKTKECSNGSNLPNSTVHTSGSEAPIGHLKCTLKAVRSMAPVKWQADPRQMGGVT